MKRRTCRILAGMLTGLLAFHPPLVGANKASDVMLAPRLLYYSVVCFPGERCQVDCFQGGRTILSRPRIESGDVVTLVFTDGFSDRLQPLWMEIKSENGRGLRTVLLPRDALCDFEGMAIKAFPTQ